MLILKSFLLSTVLMSFSIRDANLKPYTDYEFMLGGYNSNFNIEIEQEKQNNKYYNYFHIKHNYVLENKTKGIDTYIMNNEEDNIYFYNINIYDRFLSFLTFGVGIISKGNGLKVNSTLEFIIKKFCILRYIQSFDTYLYEGVFFYKYKVTNSLYVVPKLKYLKLDEKQSYQFKIQLEYKIKH